SGPGQRPCKALRRRGPPTEGRRAVSRSPVVCPDAGFPEPRADDVAIRVRGATLFERAGLGRHRRAPLLAGVLDPGGEDRALRAAPAVPRPRRGEPEPALAALDE